MGWGQHKWLPAHVPRTVAQWGLVGVGCMLGLAEMAPAVNVLALCALRCRQVCQNQRMLPRRREVAAGKARLREVLHAR